MAVTIEEVEARSEPLVSELTALLRDVVDAGASVGFLPPLKTALGETYWRDVLASLGDGLVLWVARVDGRLAGTVQLAPSGKQNARHRAELQKLMVMSSHRGRGVASRLLATAEARARELGRTLLVLDTLEGSEAEPVYRHLGWQRVGAIPDFAETPEGLRATVYYYKKLAA
ncbi:MAG TPA: GNAT family N-acetyltransferase [Usitatibacter sp.]|jgi:GNAT superfamily N-acetyltransferase|nr:GNAT family N-acetyltransferase [Usitatibacter sp.]